MGNVVVISAPFLACLTGVCVVFLVMCVLQIRRRAKIRALVAGLLTVALTLVTAADAVNAHYSYLPRLNDVIGTRTWPAATLTQVNDPQAEGYRHPAGAVVELTIPGTYSHFGSHTALVYVPPQYFTEPTRRFPVVYLLHGTPGAPIDWFRANEAQRAGLAAARMNHPVLLVAPRVSRNWLDDSECVDRLQERIETYVTVDVIPSIDAQLRTVPYPSSRAVGGMSAGGYCALNLGLRHREIFSTIIDMSGYDRPTHSGGDSALFGRGPRSVQLAAANTPRLYANELALSPPMRVWLDAGRSDKPATHDACEMAQLLDRPGWTITLQLRRGGHTYATWRPALLAAVPWAAADMPSSDTP